MEQWKKEKEELQEKGFPCINLPYLEDEKSLGDKKLAETLGIHIHLAE